MSGNTKRDRSKTSKSNSAPPPPDAIRRRRRSTASLQPPTTSGIYVRSESTPERGDSSYTDNLATIEGVFLCEGHSDVERSRELQRVFPTCHYPSGLFDPANAASAVDAWLNLFWEVLRDVYGRSLPSISKKRVSSVSKSAMKKHEENLRQGERAHDVREAMEWLLAIERHLGRRSDSIGVRLRLAACSYYFGRLVERIEVREFERFAVIGKAVGSGGSKGAAVTNKGTKELYKDLKAKYQPQVEEIMQMQGIKYTPATEQLGDSLGVTGRHVRDHTDNPDGDKENGRGGKSAPRRS